MKLKADGILARHNLSRLLIYAVIVLVSSPVRSLLPKQVED
jgi:hypothetical protein